ncbi:caspase-9 [Python bivittatus]|uniref:Caspase-9 n=1 Tax=Python bivittatus TaxID=176946 RepID=A0A9F5IHL9_PYTBI|nr:caspase-9 [Python bivittatus]
MVYLLNSDPCGYCLIINNVNFNPDTELKCRVGSNIDCQRLEKRFRALHFEVLTKEDLTAQEIAQELQGLSRRDHGALDCCVVVVLSHGCESYHIQFPGAIFGTDGQRIAVQKVVSYFNGFHCPSLRGKPKLFFIQACGGEERDEGFQVDADTPEDQLEQKAVESDATPFRGPGGDCDELDAIASLPTDSDILVCYPTFPGEGPGLGPAAVPQISHQRAGFPVRAVQVAVRKGQQPGSSAAGFGQCSSGRRQSRGATGRKRPRSAHGGEPLPAFATGVATLPVAAAVRGKDMGPARGGAMEQPHGPGKAESSRNNSASFCPDCAL